MYNCFFFVFMRVFCWDAMQAEDRLTQLAGSVLQNGFHGYEQSVAGQEVVWNTGLIKQDENETKPFALLVLEGSVTALFGEELNREGSEDGGSGGGTNTEREQVLGPGAWFSPAAHVGGICIFFFRLLF